MENENTLIAPELETQEGVGVTEEEIVTSEEESEVNEDD